MARFVKFQSVIDGTDIFVSPDRVIMIENIIDPRVSHCALLHMVGDEKQCRKVIGTPAEVAEKLVGDESDEGS